jgi:hypothetical protein
MLPIKAGWLVTLVATAGFAGAGAGYGIAQARASAIITCPSVEVSARPHDGVNKLATGTINRTPGMNW